MPQKSFRDALNEALHLEMERDSSVIVLGEDVSGGAGGTSGQREASGGIFGVTKGLLPKFGAERVIDTPISESAIIGAAGGAALAGMRPVAELMFADFVGVSMDQIFNQMAKFRYMFGGKTRCPAVVRLAMGAGMNMGAQHSQSIYSLLTVGAWAEGRGALERLRRKRPVDPGHPRRRSGDVLRAQGALPAQG
jgi:acetoin:2,6-dichlorophenolindophenol oxidoreductase subunit beta